MIVAVRGEKRGSSSSVWNFYRCGTVRIDMIKLCGAVDLRTARFSWFIVVFHFIKKRKRLSARYSRSFWSLCMFTRNNRWWTLDCWIVLTCLWAVRRNKPALPGAAAAAGQDEGGIFFFLSFGCSDYSTTVNLQRREPARYQNVCQGCYK